MSEFRSGLPVLLFESQAEFMYWLHSHSCSAKGAWLRFAKKGAGFRTLTKSEAIDSALCHGWIDGQLNKYDALSWLIRFTPRTPRSKWSANNRARVLELIEGAQMTPSGLVEVDAAKADGRWAAAYAPASSAEVPPDLRLALDHNPKASAFFSTLTGANRYAILYQIATVKRTETRARKVAEFVAMLERGETVHG